MRRIKKSLQKLLRLEEQASAISLETLAKEKFTPIIETKDHDIFIIGYPKSGNTWMQNLIAGVQYGIETSLLPDTLTQELIPDIHGKYYYKRFSECMFFKSHNLPQKNMKRVIHLVRDGRDAMASYYAMNKAMGKNTTLEEMIVYGKDIYPSKWHEHTRQWINNPYNAETLIVKYEDLIKDPFTQIKAVLAFAQLDRSDEVINKAIHGNSFGQMKRKEAVFGWNNKNWDPQQDFIRKGKIGTYKKEMPENLIHIFELESNKELEYFNYL
ncbi:sulfotransferase domain-containing protein [Salegentibacter sp. JZCK2]|uniref:sulfotransferase domain-containing protein n=1 Tax=Salegentibacter tibetensis TaxID=2873600 RepID=UPI001CD034ED|nr:sulfotransferase domain-containing protein [Salegentibacter tibetensis]MBZ9729738.1 sulfotransferase domain-containing protein [Salegentibacter tibetensis]